MNSQPSEPMKNPRFVLFIIVAAQFFGTSVWFGGNAVVPQLQVNFHWSEDAVAWVTSLTQIGFIAGTLVFALVGITDRFSPSRVFFVSSILASISCSVVLIDISSLTLLLSSRVLTGFFLAGIYPVGMKLASDWSERGLGMWLGALVGALVLGTSFPHLIRAYSGSLPLQFTFLFVSTLCATGGVLVLSLVGDGPFRKKATRFSLRSIAYVVNTAPLRSAALGYFGHMWELYAFWAFLPVYLTLQQRADGAGVSAETFVVIASGAVGCVAGGWVSLRAGSHVVASVALLTSGICCAVSPFALTWPPLLFGAFLLLWGITVSADSPQFSTMVSKSAPEEYRGTAITLVTCLGFGISVLSIQLLSWIKTHIDLTYLFLFLLPGPVLGLLFFRKVFRQL